MIANASDKKNIETKRTYDFQRTRNYKVPHTNEARVLLELRLGSLKQRNLQTLCVKEEKKNGDGQDVPGLSCAQTHAHISYSTAKPETYVHSSKTT